jgi:glycosyltransferase involved in cell wall biosynthesis
MHVVLVHDARLPVIGYGGTERLVWWIAKGLSEEQCRVTLLCRKGSHCQYAERVVEWQPEQPAEALVPDADVFHYFATPGHEPRAPHLVTIGGNGKAGETYLPNTVFVSRNHAARHGSSMFVYNGIDPDEYRFEAQKSDYLAFCAKASWRVKNVDGAISLARKSKRLLRVIGGRRVIREWRGVRWEGMLAGAKKADALAKARALLNPIIWNEPFGLAVAEALVSGTPVIASRRGSMPELVSPDVGAICETEREFLDAIEHIASIKPDACRQRALDLFHYRTMVNAYVSLYRRTMDGEQLNPQPPRAVENLARIIPLRF